MLSTVATVATIDIVVTEAFVTTVDTVELLSFGNVTKILD